MSGKVYSSRFDDELEEKLEAEAKRRNFSPGAIIRVAVEEYLDKDKRTHNMGVLIEKLERLEYENAKTRGVLRRAFAVSDSDVEEAGKDAAAYLEERKGT